MNSEMGDSVKKKEGSVSDWNLDRILEMVEEAGGEMMLCPADKDHRGLIRYMLKDLVPEDYPKLYEALEHSILDGTPEVMKKGMEDGWEDGLFLPFAYRESGRIHANFVTSTAQNIYGLLTMLCLCGKRADGRMQIVDESGMRICYPPKHTLSGHAWLNEKGAGVPGDAPIVLQFSGWVTRDGWFKAEAAIRRIPEGLRGMHVYEGAAAEKRGAADSGLLQIELSDPVHSKTAAGKPIVLSYNRDSQAGENVDYSFPQHISSTQFHFPCRGKARFADQSMHYRGVKEPGTTSASSMILVRDGGGILNYRGIFNDHAASALGGFTWDFSDKNWNAEAGFKWDTYFGSKLYFTLQYMTNKLPVGGVLVVNSTDDVQDDKVKIDTLAVYWGCLAEGTEVTMADGGRTLIERIHIGELVQSLDGPILVRDILKGDKEQDLRRLTTERGRGILATREHPVLTAEGVKLVMELNPGYDRIVMEDGETALLEGIVTEWIGTGTVYNLELQRSDQENPAEEGSFFFADGMTVGDNRMQGWASREYQKKRQEKYGLPAEWRKDVESARRQFDFLKDVDILWK